MHQPAFAGRIREAGSVAVEGSLGYLPQTLGFDGARSVAEVLGVAPVLGALNALAGLGVGRALLVVLSYLRWQVFPYRREDTFEQWVTAPTQSDAANRPEGR